MEIKRADSKGRLTVGEDGKVYSVVRDEATGVISLYPVTIPKPMPVTLDHGDLRALYFTPATRSIGADLITIYSSLGGGPQSNAEFLASIANTLKIPVVVNNLGSSYGYAAVYPDLLANLVDRGVVVSTSRVG